MPKIQVTYPGLFGTVYRAFDDEERAIQWSRQCGVYEVCTIAPVDPLDKWEELYSGCFKPLDV